MDVRLSPEQQALRDSVAQVVDRLGPQAVGQLDDAERAEKLDAAVTASGWRELRSPESESGPSGSYAPPPLASGVEVAIVAEELGRRLADTSYLGPILAAELRRLVGAPTVAMVETVAFAPGLGAPARGGGGADRPEGLAVDSRGATTALVLLAATSPDGHTAFRLGENEVQSGGEQVDLTRATGTVELTEVTEVAGQQRALTDDDLTRWTALGLAATSADLVGVMRGAVRLACDYAAERRQYGSAIGSFQAVQHLLADALVAMEGSRSAALHAAWAVDSLPPNEALAAGAVAKAYSSRAARTVCETAIQVHGGIGNTWECLAHVYLRRALLSIDLFGGAGPNLERVLAHNRIGEPVAIGGTDGLR